MNGSILVAGTSSDVGKSVIVAGICRSLARRGVRVAPFKALNMSLNSVVTPDGSEIGRAQAAQAQAAGVPPEAAMNPILFKPATARSTQVVVMGRAITVADGLGSADLRSRLLSIALEAFDSLRARFDVVICEGAGSLAETNLRERDIANMGLARAASLPVVVVADIDRGGAFASLLGSLALLDPDDQALVSAFLLNKFRGDRSLLAPAVERIERLTARRVLGILPWTEGAWVDAEDSVALERPRGAPAAPVGRDTLTVAVVRLPRISNFTDVDPLVTEPGVFVWFTQSFTDVLEADLVVLPGTKATVEDLAWLRATGLDEAIRVRANRGAPVIGICGGYQMLGRRIVDRVESGAGEVQALAILPVDVVFAEEKTLRQSVGTAPGWGGAPVAGYEIRHGHVNVSGGRALFHTPTGHEGCCLGAVLGTSWHGIFETDQFRRLVLGWVADTRGLDWIPGSGSYAEVREGWLDRLGDLERYIETEALFRLIEEGAQPGIPSVRAFQTVQT